MSRASHKLTMEVLLPGEHHWERWVLSTEGLKRAYMWNGLEVGGFNTESRQLVLALPTSAFWHLPLWLSGDPEHFMAMAQLHLERLGIKGVGGSSGTSIVQLIQQGDHHLLSVKALKNQAAPLATGSSLPTRCIATTDLFSFEPNTVTLWRELGRLVMAVSAHNHIIYQTPLTSLNLDDEAIAEIKQICFQMVFQQSLSAVDRFILRIEQVDSSWQDSVSRTLSLPVEFQERKGPKLSSNAPIFFELPDLKLKEKIQQKRKKRRLQIILAGLLLMATGAIIFILQIFAARERDNLLDQLAILTPQAFQIEQQRRHWQEVSPALDPNSFPTAMLLSLMESPVSSDIALMRFEWTPQRVIVQAHALSTNAALQYTQDIRANKVLAIYNWMVPAPVIAEDDSATFELTGIKEGVASHE